MPKAISLSDKFDIHELIARYSHAVEDGDTDGVLACFTQDGTFEGRMGRLEGHEALRILGNTVKPDAQPRHIVSNILLKHDDALPNTVRAKSNIAFYVVTPDGFSFRTSGVYHDVIIKTPEGWKFSSRKVALDTPR